MPEFVLGSVPYVNAAPLIGKFILEGPGSPVEVMTEVPSRLPAWLESGQADAILVSSIEALRRPDARVASEVGILSRGRVDSVRLFSRVPWEEVQSLALDSSSMTSVALASILLAEVHGVRPRHETHAPSLEAMLRSCDAALLIGDLGMEADGSGLEVMDLGEEWTRLTGLPFVWALWLGEVTPRLSHLLLEAWEWSGLGADAFRSPRPEALEMAQRASGWTMERVRTYLTETMSFRMDEEAWKGLDLFRQKIEEHRLAEGLCLPRPVAPLQAAASAD